LNFAFLSAWLPASSTSSRRRACQPSNTRNCFRLLQGCE
jgi:hypothetical protein